MPSRPILSFRLAGLLPVLASLILLAGCASKKAWQAEGVVEFRVLNTNSEKCGTVSDPEKVRELLDCFSRATPSLDPNGLSRPWTHKVDIVGTSPECDRWLYSDRTGEYVLLSVYGTTVKKLAPVDRERVNELLPRKVEDPFAALRTGG